MTFFLLSHCRVTDKIIKSLFYKNKRQKKRLKSPVNKHFFSVHYLHFTHFPIPSIVLSTQDFFLCVCECTSFNEATSSPQKNLKEGIFFSSVLMAGLI